MGCLSWIQKAYIQGLAVPLANTASFVWSFKINGLKSLEDLFDNLLLPRTVSFLRDRFHPCLAAVFNTLEKCLSLKCHMASASSLSLSVSFPMCLRSKGQWSSPWVRLCVVRCTGAAFCCLCLCTAVWVLWLGANWLVSPSWALIPPAPPPWPPSTRCEMEEGAPWSITTALAPMATSSSPWPSCSCSMRSTWWSAGTAVPAVSSNTRPMWTACMNGCCACGRLDRVSGGKPSATILYGGLVRSHATGTEMPTLQHRSITSASTHMSPRASLTTAIVEWRMSQETCEAWRVTQPQGYALPSALVLQDQDLRMHISTNGPDSSRKSRAWMTTWRHVKACSWRIWTLKSTS